MPKKKLSKDTVDDIDRAIFKAAISGEDVFYMRFTDIHTGEFKTHKMDLIPLKEYIEKNKIKSFGRFKRLVNKEKKREQQNAKN